MCEKFMQKFIETLIASQAGIQQAMNIIVQKTEELKKTYPVESRSCTYEGRFDDIENQFDLIHTRFNLIEIRLKPIEDRLFRIEAALEKTS